MMIDTKLTIAESAFVAEDVCRMRLRGEIPPVSAGQFVHVAVPGYTLRRPFCMTTSDARSVEILFAVIGGGTRALAALPVGAAVDCILPIGNGFPVPPAASRALILGGGLGVAPLLPILAEHRALSYRVLLGFGTKDKVVEEADFRALCDDVTVATDDGSYGYAGRVTELIPAALRDFRPDVVYVCGPTPMLRAAQAVDFGCPAYVSMEARMGCGVGACLVCTCPVRHDTVVRNLRVCVDGPVFLLSEVDLGGVS